MEKDDYGIIDNFLSEEEFKAIQDTMLGDDFPWYYTNGVIKPEDDNAKNQYQLIHLFYSEGLPRSSYFNIMAPITLKLNPLSWLRIKANLNPRTEDFFEHGYHADFDKTIPNQRTAVFYLNTNNGYTLFEDGTKIESVRNRLVWFKTHLLHTGSTCTDMNRRVLLNLNYIV